MRILEFDLPSFIMPTNPYWIRELSIVLVPTGIQFPITDLWRPKTATKAIFYDWANQDVKKILCDFVVFSNLIHQNHPLFEWYYNKTFSSLAKNEQTIDDLEEYISSCFEQQNWYLSVDYDDYPLLERANQPTKINFRDYFIPYTNIKSSDQNQTKIKRLIEFYAYDSISQMIVDRIYSNSNLHISNYFVLLEALVNMEIKNIDDYEVCPHCKGRIRKKRNMLHLVGEYFKLINDNPEVHDILMAIAKEHYKSRNQFFHDAKFESENDKIEKLIKEIGRKQFNYDEEIKHAGASLRGFYIMKSIIRQELLKKLKEQYSCT